MLNPNPEIVAPQVEGALSRALHEERLQAFDACLRELDSKESGWAQILKEQMRGTSSTEIAKTFGKTVDQIDAITQRAKSAVASCVEGKGHVSMRLPILNLPESDAALTDWVERELLGPDLSSLVAELIYFGRGRNNDLPRIRVILDGDIKQILHQGFSKIEPARLRELLAYPALLIQFQDAIFLKGGPYWTRQLQGVDGLDPTSRGAEVPTQRELPSSPERRGRPRGSMTMSKRLQVEKATSDSSRLLSPR